MVDPRLQVSEPPPSDVGMMMPVSSFLQPPESPDQEIEINAAGKKIPYVLRPITIDSRPGPPSSINLENLHNSSDPRLQKYLNHNQTNAKTRSGNNEMDSSDSVVPAKPTDPRLSKRGGGGGGSEPFSGHSRSFIIPPLPPPSCSRLDELLGWSPPWFPRRRGPRL